MEEEREQEEEDEGRGGHVCPPAVRIIRSRNDDKSSKREWGDNELPNQSEIVSLIRRYVVKIAHACNCQITAVIFLFMMVKPVMSP